MCEQNKRDWVSLLVVPIIILSLGWWYNDRSDDRAQKREIKKQRIQLMSQVIEHVWLNKLCIEGVVKSRMTTQHYQNKKSLNESYSKLFTDKQQVFVYFQGIRGKELANKIGEYIVLGGDDQALTEFATKNDSKIGKLGDAIILDSVTLLHDTEI